MHPNGQNRGGIFQQSFLAEDGHKGRDIARIPHPNAGPPHYGTSSEVATMHYLRTKLQLSIPMVMAYLSVPSNPVGAEYIVMERVCGVNLSKIWDRVGRA